jgi:hypothetical protein
MTLNRPTRLIESHRTIDQTIPHQLIVSKLLGAIICDPALRIIRTDDAARPFVTMTDMLSDLRGAADLAVSFDGSFKYGLLIEVKTTTKQARGNLALFNEVTNSDRNMTQLGRLAHAAPLWWYVIVNTSKLTAKTHEEHELALLDCPAVLIEGHRGDTRPQEVTGFERFGLLLNKLYELLPDISVTRTETQLALLPVDDVPVVTMDQPLRMPTLAPVAPAPQPAPEPEPAPVPAPVAEVERYLPNESQALLFETLERELTLLGGVEAVLDKFPAEVVNEFNTLITLSGEQRISVCSLRPQRLFVRSQLHLTTTGALVLAWRQASFKRSANGQLQRLTMRSLPTLHYRVGSVKQKLHLISALAKNIS